MYWKVILLSALVVLACCAVPVSATPHSDTSDDIVSTPWYNYKDYSSKSSPIYGWVSMGKTNQHIYPVSGKNYIETAVSWSANQNEISLTVIRPDNYMYGPYYDSFDGVIDGTIPIALTGNLMNGIWRVAITGVNVVGTQQYTVIFNAN